MFKAVRMLSIAVVAMGFIACGKSKEEKAKDRAEDPVTEQKAKDRAEDLVAEQNALVVDLNGLGTPISYWSDQSLNDYEAKLNRLEVVEDALRSSDGRNGVTIIGGDNRRFIEQRRGFLRRARAEKLNREAATGINQGSSTPPSGAGAEGSDSSESKIRKAKEIMERTSVLKSKDDDVQSQIKALGTVDENSSIETIETYERLLGQSENIGQELTSAFQELVDLNYSNKANSLAAQNLDLLALRKRLRDAERLRLEGVKFLKDSKKAS